MPDDVADAGFDLDDGATGRVGITLITALKVAICGFTPARDPMRTDLFDFTLPDDRIALRPASPRDAARSGGAAGRGG